MQNSTRSSVKNFQRVKTIIRASQKALLETIPDQLSSRSQAKDSICQHKVEAEAEQNP